MRPGAKCQRAECLGNSAIIWCNFDTKHKTLPSWNNVADGAQTIVDHCKEAGKVSGIHWHDDLWAVIVQEQECYPNNPN
ncbi:hypothetical protein BJY04DRAFT_191654 [Aspergillus karnatakaensis]|uniref:uncharacterized protein n=1 Tax=Aspergillus karnatakaensis TaxID=1810916 RepID=UPI003CCD615B